MCIIGNGTNPQISADIVVTSRERHISDRLRMPTRGVLLRIRWCYAERSSEGLQSHGGYPRGRGSKLQAIPDSRTFSREAVLQNTESQRTDYPGTRSPTNVTRGILSVVAGAGRAQGVERGSFSQTGISGGGRPAPQTSALVHSANSSHCIGGLKSRPSLRGGTEDPAVPVQSRSPDRQPRTV